MLQQHSTHHHTIALRKDTFPKMPFQKGRRRFISESTSVSFVLSNDEIISTCKQVKFDHQQPEQMLNSSLESDPAAQECNDVLDDSDICIVITNVPAVSKMTELDKTDNDANSD